MHDYSGKTFHCPQANGSNISGGLKEISEAAKRQSGTQDKQTLDVLMEKCVPYSSLIKASEPQCRQRRRYSDCIIDCFKSLSLELSMAFHKGFDGATVHPHAICTGGIGLPERRSPVQVGEHVSNISGALKQISEGAKRKHGTHKQTLNALILISRMITHHYACC